MNDFESFMNYITKTPYNSNPKIISGMVNSIINTNLDEYEERVFGKIAEYHPEDNLTLLELDKSYESLLVRSDWPDVSVYCFDSDNNGAVCRLVSGEEDSNEEPLDEINLSYLIDNQNGMPVPVLKITINGEKYTCYSTQFHDTDQTYAASWYGADGSRLDSAPSLVNMIFDYLIVGDNSISSLTGLSNEQNAALEALSRIVNVSTDAMGSLGTVDDGVERLTCAPKVGRRYAFSTNKDIIFQLPNIEYSKKKQEFYVDLNCVSSINLSFSDTIYYEDGENIDTTSGKHRLYFYTLIDSQTWTVKEIESISLITEESIPEYAIPFSNVTINQLRSILKYGYKNSNDKWCARKKGVEIEFFSVGDTRSVTLTNGQEVMIRIIGIEYDNLKTSGKAALTCDFEEVLQTGSSTTYGSPTNYATSGFRSVVKDIVSLLPNDLLTLVVPVKKESHGNVVTSDKVWVFSFEETYDPNGYPIFTDNASRIRMNQDGSATSWGLREYNSDSTWYAIVDSGTFVYQGKYTDDVVDYVAVGFCLSA